MRVTRILAITGVSLSLFGVSQAEIETSFSAGYTSEYVYRGALFGDDLWRVLEPARSSDELLRARVRVGEPGPREHADGPELRGEPDGGLSRRPLHAEALDGRARGPWTLGPPRRARARDRARRRRPPCDIYTPRGRARL